MLNDRSLQRLQNVHPHLVTIIRYAAELLPQAHPDLSFQITEGVRTLERQKQLVAQGASRTLNSRHIPATNGFAHAVDIVVYVGDRVSWEFPLYKTVSDVVKSAASKLGHPVEWGGDWQSLKDGPHFQLPFHPYDGRASLTDTPAPQPSEADLRTLMIGASGALVMTLQQALNKTGAAIKVDGSFGNATYAAVKAFQQTRGLKPDGIVGPATWKALGHG